MASQRLGHVETHCREPVVHPSHQVRDQGPRPFALLAGVSHYLPPQDCCLLAGKNLEKLKILFVYK